MQTLAKRALGAVAALAPTTTAASAETAFWIIDMAGKAGRHGGRHHGGHHRWQGHGGGHHGVGGGGGGGGAPAAPEIDVSQGAAAIVIILLAFLVAREIYLRRRPQISA
jgi:hypothetical protein